MNISLGPYNHPFAAWRPRDGRVFDFFALDTETTDIDEGRPDLTPSYVLGAASDGQRGVFISRENVLPFFEAHRGVPFICHNASFDLRVLDVVLKPTLEVYQAVDDHLVWDTLVLNRLYMLATAGHTARGESGLADCARTHLGIDLDKGTKDAQGRDVRVNFGQFLGQPPSTIPSEYLSYLARDVLATWHLFQTLDRQVKGVLQTSHKVWGYVDTSWMEDVIRRFGPLTHHVQLKASILMTVLTANGIAIDPGRSEDKADRLRQVRDALQERLRRRGYLPGQKGSNKALQSILREFRRNHPGVELRRTPSGGNWSTAEEDLVDLAREDDFFADLLRFRAAEKLLSTYLTKMGRPRLHPKFGYLLQTGRTYCGGGFNLQNLPKEKDEGNVAATVRGCFVPAEGRVFIDLDYSQIELVVLAFVLEHQFGLTSELARLINAGRDIHRHIAAVVLGKEPTVVSKGERDSAKPVSFGRPGGMGPSRLQQIARAGYGIELTLEEVEQRINAYHQLCPELDPFLGDEVDTGRVLAERLMLTPARYCQATRRYYDQADPLNAVPAGWLGGMLLKVLRDESPATRNGRSYTPEEVDFFWQAAGPLAEHLGEVMRSALERHQPGEELWSAVRSWAGRRPVFTVTGRLRAGATFCSARNCVFQGPAADGAILGLWRVWRDGHKLVDFVHDQIVVESPADGEVSRRAADIEGLMRAGMLEVVPGMRVGVETVVTKSLNKKELDPRYAMGTAAAPPVTGAAVRVELSSCPGRPQKCA